MNTAKKIRHSSAKIIRLRTATDKKLTRTALTVAHSALWNNKQFSSKEQENHHELMKEHFQHCQSFRARFIEIVERIALAKRYLSRAKGRYVAKAVDWLNIEYHNGLAGTTNWLYQVKMQRKSCPEYNKGIRVLANAILAYVENSSAYTIMRYRKLLIKDRHFDLLQIFNNTIVNFQINQL